MPDPTSAASGRGVQVVGLDDAGRAFREWADDLGRAVDKGARPFAVGVASKVRAQTPVLTGLLASTVGVVALTDADGDAGVGVGYVNPPDYAPFVPAGRYLYPTATAAADQWSSTLADIATDTAEDFPWPRPKP